MEDGADVEACKGGLDEKLFFWMSGFRGGNADKGQDEWRDKTSEGHCSGRMSKVAFSWPLVLRLPLFDTTRAGSEVCWGVGVIVS